MNAVYGVVWEQESKDYRKKYNLTGKVPLIDIVYDSSTYRSIFEMTLLDLYDKYKDLCIDRTTAINQMRVHSEYTKQIRDSMMQHKKKTPGLWIKRRPTVPSHDPLPGSLLHI